MHPLLEKLWYCFVGLPTAFLLGAALLLKARTGTLFGKREQ